MNNADPYRKLEFPLTQLNFSQSSKTLVINVRRLGYLFCSVEVDWFTDKGHKGHLAIPDQIDQAEILIELAQEPRVDSPIEVMEVHLSNPTAENVTPVLGSDKCFVKITNDICEY